MKSSASDDASRTAAANAAPAAKTAAKSAAKAAPKAPAKTVAKAPTKATTTTAKPTAKSKPAPTKAADRAASIALLSDDDYDALDQLSDAEFLDSQRALLLTDRETYLGQARMLRAEADQLAQDMEPGDVQFDDESGEGATMSVERERDLAMSAQAAAAVEDIDRALARIQAGTYGVCEGCRGPIPRARLRALPYATLCIQCKNGGLSRR